MMVFAPIFGYLASLKPEKINLRFITILALFLQSFLLLLFSFVELMTNRKMDLVIASIVLRILQGFCSGMGHTATFAIIALLYSAHFLAHFLSARMFIAWIFISIANVEAKAFYGKHYPNGEAAVQHIYGNQGMWKEMNPLEYIWNYYDFCGSEKHPTNKDLLISYANGSRFFTALDANCHLLFDFDKNGEIDSSTAGFAFFEHNGRGSGGVQKSLPFTVFWYDDNWFAKYMSEAYQMQIPFGLSEYNDFVRWKVIGGDLENWKVYPDNSYQDQVCLNALYYFFKGDLANAQKLWDKMLQLSQPLYVEKNQRYEYSGITENYKMGLFQIITAFLLDSESESEANRIAQLTENWVYLRSNILSRQEFSSSYTLLGWTSDINGESALMNTESIAANVLGLGAGALETFEAGKFPIQCKDTQSFIQNAYHTLSAIPGISKPGFMSCGPFKSYPPGNYQVDFFLKPLNSSVEIAILDIYDHSSNSTLASSSLSSTTTNHWTRSSLFFSLLNSSNSLEFRTYWLGKTHLDLASIRIRTHTK
jgi:hypothetical protein